MPCLVGRPFSLSLGRTVHNLVQNRSKMKHRPCFFGIAFILFSHGLFGQQNIVGIVADEDNNPIPYANVLLLRSRDSTMITGTISTEEGQFDLVNNSNEQIMVKITLLGFKDLFSPALPQGDDINLGTMQLPMAAQTLSEVVVRGEKPLIQQKIDRTVVNVQSAVSSVGNTALNVLAKSPSVMVNRSTNQISLMGKQGVLVMMDNKQMRMEMQELINFLANMPADNIDTIELITSPPASYDAQGIGGIININTVRKSGEGWTGSFTTNGAYGRRAKYGGSLNLSYQKDRVYFFANASANFNHNYEDVSLFTDYSTSEERVLSDLFIERRSNTGLYATDVGLDYDLGKNTTIGLISSINIRDWKMDAISETDVQSTGNGDFIEFVESFEKNYLFRTLLNVNFRHSFSQNSSLRLDYDHIGFKRENPTDYDVLRLYDDGSGKSSDFISDTNTPLDINVFKADFNTSLSDKIDLETGVKTTLSKFRNDVVVSRQADNGFEEDGRFTDIFDMEEEIHAAYISSDWKLNPSLLLKAGLRYEYYRLDLGSAGQGQIVDQIQNNLFPSIYLNYKKSEDSEWNLSYVQRIKRPSFLNLAPYFYFFNQNTLFTGNPNLVPSMANQFKIDYRHKRLNLGLQFTDTQNPIFNWHPALEGDPQAVVFRAQQGNRSQIASLTANVPWRLYSWWTSRYNLLANYLVQTPRINGVEVTARNTSYILSTVQSFDLGHDFTLEVSGEYNSTQYEGVIRTEPRVALDMGLRKRFPSGTTLSLNVSDVLNTSSEWNIISDTSDYDVFYDWLFDNEGPVFRLSLMVPFGNNTSKDRERRRSGSDEEQRRLN